MLDKYAIINAIMSLSRSQGFYGRLLRDIEQNPKILEDLEQQKFNDVLDMVLYLEC
jgi:hypothetical protein